MDQKLDQKLNQKATKVSKVKQIKSEIVQRLQRQGLKLSLQDFVMLIEAYSPKRSHQFLSYALDLVKPFTAGLGITVRKLTDEQAVLVVEPRARNQISDGVAHSAVLTAAAQEAVECLLERHSPVAGFQAILSKSEIELKKRYSGILTLHFQWDPVEREKKLIQIQKNREALSDFLVEVKDSSSKMVAEVRLNYLLKFKPRIAQ